MKISSIPTYFIYYIKIIDLLVSVVLSLSLNLIKLVQKRKLLEEFRRISPSEKAFKEKV
jgi:hypothetical protein